MNCQICGAELPSDALFCGECGSSTSATPQSRQRADARPSDTTVIQSLRPRQSTGIISVSLAGGTLDSGAVDPSTAPAEEPLEAVVAPSEPRGAASGISFMLQFSTGETFDVSGNGLIGRRPLPQAQERFDHLIQITDPGRSVSKSHLEFGQHEGELWVSDRASGNGTIVRRPDGTEIVCEAGRRYLVGRGTRVEIGEQFFVIA
ncbi:MAG: zinc-ribbon domain-containing protein [Microterricola sp.]